MINQDSDKLICELQKMNNELNKISGALKLLIHSTIPPLELDLREEMCRRKLEKEYSRIDKLIDKY